MGWAIGPAPVLLQQWIWTKVHPLITAAHLAGWLVRLVVCAAAFVLLVH